MEEKILLPELPPYGADGSISDSVYDAGSSVGDQKRVATPAEAVADGATHLVVGRPIMAAADPAAAARAIRAEMNG